MCIIVIKKEGKLPSKKILETCFENNPDGAGFMYVRNKKIIIKKGFMNFETLDKALSAENFTKKDTIVYHFRIATSGDTTEKQCHPFPVSSKVADIEAGNIACDIGFAHNGILQHKPEGTLSDSMIFVRDILSNKDIMPHLFSDNVIFKLIEQASIGSKLAFLSPYKIRYTGTWIAKDNLLFSNNGYEKDLFPFGFGSKFSLKHYSKKSYFYEQEICKQKDILPCEDCERLDCDGYGYGSCPKENAE